MTPITIEDLAKFFVYDPNEKKQLRKCVRIYSNNSSCNTSLFWNKLTSCCGYSPYTRALMTLEGKAVSVLKERLHIKDSGELVNRSMILAKFVLGYLIDEARTQTEKAVLLDSGPQKINLYDVLYRAPFSNDNSLGFPNHNLLFKLFREEYNLLEKVHNQLSVHLDMNPDDKRFKSVDFDQDFIPFSDVQSACKLVNNALEKCADLLEDFTFNRKDVQHLYDLFIQIRMMRLNTEDLQENLTLV